jgi:hypothetical protein
LPLPVALPGDEGIAGVGSFGSDGIDGVLGVDGFDGVPGVPGVWFGVGGFGAGVTGPWPGDGDGVGEGGVGDGVVGELGDPPAVPPAPGACAPTGAASANMRAIDSFMVRMTEVTATSMHARLRIEPRDWAQTWRWRHTRHASVGSSTGCRSSSASVVAPRALLPRLRALLKLSG